MAGYNFNLSALADIFKTCLSYVPVCIFTAAAALLVGVAAGILLALIRSSKLGVVRLIGNAYVLVMRSVPSILLLLLIYYFVRYGLASISDSVPPITIAVLALSLSSAAFMSNTVRSALSSVEAGQREAGLSLGMKPRTVFVRYVLPQAIPVALPMLGSQFISMLRATSLISYVGVMDIVMAGKIKGTLYSNNLEAYFAEAIIYWLLTILLERIFAAIHKRNRWHNSIA